jgi:hypothetical protein
VCVRIAHPAPSNPVSRMNASELESNRRRRR